MPVDSVNFPFKISISSSYLYKHLLRVSSVIVSKPLLTILDDFLLIIKNDTMKIVASDNTTTLYSYLSIEEDRDIIDKIGSGINIKIAVPNKILLDTLKNLPEQPLELLYDANKFVLIIKSTNGKYKIMCDNPDGYPLNEYKKTDKKIVLQGKKFIEAIENTIVVASNEQVKPVLNSVMFEIDSNQLISVATDMPRLIKYTVNLSESYDGYTTFIVSKKAVSLLKNILIEEEVFLYIGSEYVKNEVGEAIEHNKYIYVESGNDIFVSALIQEEYPDYKKVIPINYRNKLFIDRIELISALKRLISFTSVINFQIKFNISNNKIMLVAEDPNNENDAYEEIMCNYEFQNIMISFNVKNLLEILQIIKTDIILFACSEPNPNNISNKAVIIEPFVKNGEVLNYNFLALIMPIYM